MKKTIAIMLVLTMSACMICGCGKSNKKKSSKETSKETIENSNAVENESSLDENNSDVDNSEGNNSNTDESLTDGTQNPEIDYLFVYDDFLFETYQFIVGMNDETIPSDEQIGIFEALRGEDKDSVLFKIGYCMKDINDDNIPELFIMLINENDSNSYMGSRILAAYSYKDNAPVNILVGTSRNRYYLIDDNTIFNEGSNGAAYTIFATYTLSKDGSSLVAKDYYFTSPINNDYSKIGFFHNTTGELDASKSQEIEGSEDDFWKLSTDLSDKIQSYEIAPFEVFNAGPDDENTSNTSSLPVSVNFIENVTIDINRCNQFVADSSGYESQIVLTANEKVTNFQFNSLESFEDSDELLTTPMYSLDELTSDIPLVITLTFFGDIPTYGISYIDSTAAQRYFSLAISGMDGSLLVTEN